ncbi:hypothetical protein GWI33_019700 [Rhynchophorus ferrugineus]|uniref:Uncharacterized protein n=1 Tax=Rhynchophorus ferrugineus TaxID=354439 RepID=A0A834I4V0_RHYFE|nr:hypothetical protein GWI33_019700 [Rhynchophorus ferrugineus]
MVITKRKKNRTNVQLSMKLCPGDARSVSGFTHDGPRISSGPPFVGSGREILPRSDRETAVMQPEGHEGARPKTEKKNKRNTRTVASRLAMSKINSIVLSSTTIRWSFVSCLMVVLSFCRRKRPVVRNRNRIRI